LPRSAGFWRLERRLRQVAQREERMNKGFIASVKRARQDSNL
jgi:hypothetical protein